ncbi:unnamed protein product [Orchesella dallaii]|uniref:Protein HTATIP2 n=1 Tax=Orchesella dallaii TaxID=48710 RepID=A0ABP1S6P2_9HEXA
MIYTFSAIVLGATGQVGKEIVKELANNDRILKVTLLLRRPLELPYSTDSKYAKFTQHVIDFDQLPEYKDLFIDHDVVFCALGTHSTYASDRNLFYKVDHHFVLDSARLAKDGGCHHFIVITMKGANPHSRLFYYKVKGEVEEDLKAVRFYRLSIFRPGFLLCPHRKYAGWLESVSHFAMKRLDIWRNASIETKEIAKVMVQQCFAPKQNDVEVYENKMIHSLAK